MRPFKVFVPFAMLSGVLIAQQPAAPPTTGQRPTAPPTQRGYNFPAPLFQQPNVGTSLNLTPAQTRQLAEMNTRLQADWGDRFNKTWSSTGRDRDASLQQLQSQYYDTWMKGTQNIFNDAQRQRYNQLNLQYQGPSAFLNPDMQKGLNLSDEQRTQLGQLRTQYDRQFQDFRTVDPTRRDDAMKRWETMQKETSERMRSILNEQQQKTWSQMTGEQFRFAPPFSNTPTPPRP